MAIIRGDNLHLSYGPQVLLDAVDFAIEEKQKVCLVGRNGTGKSSLLKLIAEDNKPDDGQIVRSSGYRIGWLPQALPAKNELTISQFVESGLAEVKNALDEYQQMLEQGIHNAKAERLEHLIAAADGWNLDNRVKQTLSRLELPANKKMSDLSGGWRRRAALAKALVQQPDLLILDEPTNHLDMPSILWLEQQLQQFKGALLFVSHDRQFVDAIADTIFELDRGMLRAYPGRYQAYTVLKEAQLAEEDKVNREFDKKLAQEEVWIRQGIKARRTRNEGRVRALKKMREEGAARRRQVGTSQLKARVSTNSSKIVAKMKDMVIGFEQPLIKPFSGLIQRGDKIGIVGENGSGKTTFIKTLLGKMAPLTGEITVSDSLEIAYFDQLREAVDLNKTVGDNLGDGKDFVIIDGKSRHVISYMQDFCFTADRVRAPAHSLSGGEINRLLLAKLFTKSANLFVLDEPTNDLDVETLEILEQMLVEISATVIIISHDRSFLDNCCGSLLVFDRSDESEPFEVTDIVGGYNEWQHFQQARLQNKPKNSAVKLTRGQENKTAGDFECEIAKKITKQNKLSYKEQRLLESLPQTIEKLEEEITQLQAQTLEPDFYKDHENSAMVLNKLTEKEQELENVFEQWTLLEEKQG